MKGTKKKKLIVMLQELFTPLESEINPNTAELDISYFQRMQKIRDGWADNEDSYLDDYGILQTKNASKEYLSKESWFENSNSIERHADRCTLNDAVDVEKNKNKKVVDLLDVLIAIDEMENTVMGEALKYGLKRDLRKNLDLKALATLSPDEADIYSRWMGGKSQTEIAKERGTSRQAAWDSFKRITVKLSGGGAL